MSFTNEEIDRQSDASRRYHTARLAQDAALREAVELTERAEREGRELSRRERARFEELKTATEQHGQEKRRFAKTAFDPRLALGSTKSTEQNEVLGPGQRMLDWVCARRGDWNPGGFTDELLDPDRFSLGRTLRGMVTGDWQGAELERRALSEGVNANGGFLTPEPLSARLIDRIRNAMRVMQSGAQTVPMQFDTLNMARLTAGPNPAVAWKSEAASITPSDLSFDRITFTARTLPILVLMSRELFEDIPGEAAGLIEDELIQALALELDRACLRGSGTAPEPKGVLNQPGVALTALGTNGRTPTWDDAIDAVATIRTKNLEPSAILWASRTEQTLAKVKDTQGRYLEPPSAISTIPRKTTNQIPVNLTTGTSTDTSEVYVADWAQLLLGVRNSVGFSLVSGAGGGGFGPRIKVLEERYADTLSVGLLSYIRCDVQLAHPEGFVVVQGVRP